MIDIADFAVGQSRMLYGRTMHSERAAHRMYEQWHPLGVVGVDHGLQLPGRRVGVERDARRGLRQRGRLEAVAEDAARPRSPCRRSPTASSTSWRCRRSSRSRSPATRDARAHRRRSARRARVVHRLVGRRPRDRDDAWPAASAARCSMRAATTPSSSPRTPTSTSSCRAVLFGAVGTAGQRCTTTRRLIVHEARVDRARRRLADAYAQVRIGDPLDAGHADGPADRRRRGRRRTRARIAEARRRGRPHPLRRQRAARPGHCVEPTIVAGARNDWPCVQRETFAPILYVMRVRDTSTRRSRSTTACRRACRRDLHARRARRPRRSSSAGGSDCGIANVNIGTSGAEIGGAFGGEKETGGGREAGSDAWKAYMRRQTNTINWSRELPLAQGIRFGAT